MIYQDKRRKSICPVSENYRTVCIGRSAAEENPKDIPKVSTRCKDTGRCLLCKD